MVRRTSLAAFGWGRFDVRIDGSLTMLELVAAMMNLRWPCSGMATGDPALFVRQDLFSQTGGFRRWH